jgi:transcription initiation factor TFIID TATA-box-binding protein
MRKRNYTALSHSCNSTIDYTLYNTLDKDTPLALVHNVVATTQIHSSCSPIDLQYIADVLPNSIYDRRKFAAITIRIASPACTALLFTSGKVVLTGCKGWYECVMASMKIAHMLRRYTPNVDIRIQDNTIQNVVGHVSIPLKKGEILDLDAIYSEMCVQCTYQERLFPGLIFRPDNSPIVLLCFFSGKIVITGGKCTSDIMYGWKRLWPQVRRFVCKASPGHPALSEKTEAFTQTFKRPRVEHGSTDVECTADFDFPSGVVLDTASLQLVEETLTSEHSSCRGLETGTCSENTSEFDATDLGAYCVNQPPAPPSIPPPEEPQ